MQRKTFLKYLAFASVIPAAMKLNALKSFSQSLGNGPKMPALFIGHGNPMNAIQENEFVAGFRKAAKSIDIPKAILVISAHWESRGTLVTAMDNPKTIHDFGGFPEELFQQQYPAPGSSELAQQITTVAKSTPVRLDYNWGLDHGAWTVLKHMYPEANIPVVQLSIDYTLSPEKHYQLAQELADLRQQGILIIGSGNMVHNIRKVDWQRMDEVGHAYDWAAEAKQSMNQKILNGQHQDLIRFSEQGEAWKLAIPTAEHYIPLLYTLGLQSKNDDIELFNDKAVGGSLSMTSVRIG